jgi:hypothetical protein
VNRRTFFLHKGDPFASLDSRSSFGLLADFDLDAVVGDGQLRVKGKVRNRGAAAWLPSFTGLGAVNIGVHLHDGNGDLVNADYARFAVSADKVLPGQGRSVEMIIPFPVGCDTFEMVIDLVSEGVMWFEIGGGSVCRFRVRSGANPRFERVI